VDLAIAGAGMIASVHGMAARAAGLPVTRVASRTDARAAALAATVGATPVSYEELLSAPGAVIVATPPACHANHVLTAVGAGGAVLVEKPLATSLRDADALVAAETSGAVIAYGENLVFAPSVGAAVTHARDLGDLQHLEVRAVQPRPTWGDFLSEAWGGGVLFDLGVHPIAMALLLAGADACIEVRATLEGADDHPTDEHAELELRFRSGLVARVVASWRGSTTEWDAQAASAAGALRLELFPTVGLERNGDPVELAPVRTPDAPFLDQLGYLAQLEAFAATAATGTRSRCGAAFGRAVLDIVCAAYAAARTGAAEAVPFTGQRDRTPLELWRMMPR
jgi:predicted dehydrogenase